MPTSRLMKIPQFYIRELHAGNNQACVGVGIRKLETFSPRSCLFLHVLSVFPLSSCSSIPPIAILFCMVSMPPRSDYAELMIVPTFIGLTRMAMMQIMGVTEKRPRE